MWLRKLKPRFGLRTLLVLVTGVAILFGWGAHFVRKVRRTNEIAVRLRGMEAHVGFGDCRIFGIVVDENNIPDWLDRLGGEAAVRDIEYISIYGPRFDEEIRELTREDIEILAKWPALRDVALYGVNFDVDYGELLAGHKYLESLDFDSVNLAKCRFEELSSTATLRELSVSDESTNNLSSLRDRHVHGIGQLRELRSLRIYGTENITAEGLRSLRRLTLLRELQLSGMRAIGDEVLDAILKDMANLESLTLRNSSISDAAAESILRCTKLTKLTVSSSSVGDQLVERLQELPNLELVALTECSLSDSGIEGLLHCPRLKCLVLAKTQVTDAGISRLSALDKLLLLGFDARIDEAEFEELKKKMPNCDIMTSQFE